VDIVGNAIKTMRVGEPVANHTRMRAPWGIAIDASEGAGFHVILAGEAWLIPTPPEEPVLMGPGDICLVAQGASHGLADSPSTPLVPLGDDPSGYWVPEEVGSAHHEASVSMLCGSYLLNLSRPHPLVEQLPEILHLPARFDRQPEKRTIIELLGSEIELARPGITAAVPALLDLLFLYLVRELYEERSEQSGGWAAALRDPGISAALEAMQSEPGAPWTVASLASRAGLSRAAFARRFHALIGQPPLAYLTWWRMSAASQMLEADLPLATIAERIGYSSEFAFSKAFKREIGASPGAFRRSRLDPQRLGAVGEDART
jgi:AraC-like DNA-binding protein